MCAHICTHTYPCIQAIQVSFNTFIQDLSSPETAQAVSLQLDFLSTHEARLCEARVRAGLPTVNKFGQSLSRRSQFQLSGFQRLLGEC